MPLNPPPLMPLTSLYLSVYSRVTMRNVALLAQKLSELCSILFSAPPCRAVQPPPVTNLSVELCASRQITTVHKGRLGELVVIIYNEELTSVICDICRNVY